jgi:IS30 family transposase
MPIDKRPKVVKQRKRPGDIEVDFMIVRNHIGALLVITDRATVHTKLHKLENRNSNTVSKTMIKSLLKK